MSQMICDIICILSDTYFMKHHNFGPIRHRRIWIRFDWLVKQLKWFFTPCWSCLIINSSGWILIFILNSSKIHEIPVKKTVWSLTTVSVTAFSGQNCYPSYYIIDITRSVSELYFGWTSCFFAVSILSLVINLSRSCTSFPIIALFARCHGHDL